MTMANIYDFRKNLATILGEVENNGTKVVIKRFGKPVAVLMKYENKDFDATKYFGMFKGEETGENFVNRVRRSEMEKKRVNKYG